jgi:hypothetical protein
MKTIDFEGLTCFTFKSSVKYSSLSDDAKCVILESSSHPDYYAKQHFPPNKSSYKRHLFIPVKKSVTCFQDSVIRAVVKIREKVNQHLHIYPGQITFENQVHQCIHMRIEDLNLLDVLIKELKKIDIEFYSSKKVKTYEGTMIFKKHTRFLELMDSVYQDADNENRFFFKIPNHIEFDKFEEGMEQIKINCNFHLFDSFLSHFFVRDTVEDFIGIYSKHCDKNRFEELKKNIKKVFSTL